MNPLMRMFVGLLFAISSLAVHAETYVLVHGGWGGGWAMKALGNAIAEHGHQVYRPSLTGLGERAHLSSPDITLETHIQDIVNLILYEDLQDVVLVGHSYGGMVVTGVADRVSERLARRVYVEGMVPNNGESLIDIHSKAANNFSRLSRDGFVYHPRYSADAAPPKHAPQPLKTVTDKINLKHTKLDIPTLYIWTVAPESPAQEDDFYAQAERARDKGWRVVQVPGGHNIQRGQPKLLAQLIVSKADH